MLTARGMQLPCVEVRTFKISLGSKACQTKRSNVNKTSAYLTLSSDFLFLLQETKESSSDAIQAHCETGVSKMEVKINAFKKLTPLKNWSTGLRYRLGPERQRVLNPVVYFYCRQNLQALIRTRNTGHIAQPRVKFPVSGNSIQGSLLP